MESPLDLAPDLHKDEREETPAPPLALNGPSRLGPVTFGDLIAVAAAEGPPR